MLALLAVATSGCGQTLIDDHARADLLKLACAPTQLACDGNCLACSPPQNAHATCGSKGSCDFACESGFNRCAADACVAESATSCGPGCQDCSGTVPSNAIATCNAEHTCDFECQPGFLRSGTQCRRAAMLSAGFEHTCAVTTDGRAKCWGSNEFGQLGDGTNYDTDVPVDVPLPGAASAISAGYYHTCALVGGRVYCWGDNAYGELGDGTTSSRATPALVSGLTNVTSVTAGGEGTGDPRTSFAHTCAIASGRLWCWGANGSGELGDGTSATRTTPSPVTILPAGATATSVAVGERHTCALTDAGAVYCWGANDSGQLGTGGFGAQTSPATPTIASGATMVATGEAHSCALIGRTAVCWGLNASYQVDPDGEPDAYPSLFEPRVGGMQPTYLTAGRFHTCVTDTSVAGPTPICCFGTNDADQLGAETAEVREFDQTLLPPYTAVAISAGSEHTCVLTGEGGIQCWGDNEYGQLGNGLKGVDSWAPTYVSGK